MYEFSYVIILSTCQVRFNRLSQELENSVDLTDLSHKKM